VYVHNGNDLMHIMPLGAEAKYGTNLMDPHQVQLLNYLGVELMCNPMRSLGTDELRMHLEVSATLALVLRKCSFRVFQPRGCN
jgi:hypothetical protein